MYHHDRALRLLRNNAYIFYYQISGFHAIFVCLYIYSFDFFINFQLYRSMIGPDGWCIHYEKTTRKCSIYPGDYSFCVDCLLCLLKQLLVPLNSVNTICIFFADRPYFCRVESNVFQSLYGIPKKKFNQEACRSS